MDRRTFLKTVGLGSAALGTAGFILDEPLHGEPRTSDLKNWIWIPADPSRSLDPWKRLFPLMRESGIRAIVPEIYDGRHAYFASTRLPVKTDLLGKMLPLARAEDLEVHAWMWSLPCMLDDVLKKHPDWYNVNAKGESAATKPAYVNYYKFLDPGRPEVRELVQGTVKELASIPELTGVHLDYIRHPDAILARGLWRKYNIIQDKVYPAYGYRSREPVFGAGGASQRKNDYCCCLPRANAGAGDGPAGLGPMGPGRLPTHALQGFSYEWANWGEPPN